jgi:carbonic anhydrase
MHQIYSSVDSGKLRTLGLRLVFTILVAVSAAGTLSSWNVQAADFEYSGDLGPGFWGQTPGWEACSGTAANARQSPIDINNIVIDSRLKPLSLDLRRTPIDMINNGHVIEQEYEATPPSTLVLDGVLYTLAQFHFHTLSEHTVKGRHGAMELHAVFKDDPINTTKIAVVGLFYVIGKENPFLAKLIAAGLPQKKNDKTGPLADQINLSQALTDTGAYVTYPGSLTTPPCSEIVTWIVLKTPAEISAKQFQAFRHILGNDFRPIQNRNNRTILATPKQGQDIHE